MRMLASWLTMVSCRLSRWAVIPRGNMPMIATKAKPMMARLMAISIMVKAQRERRPKSEGRRPKEGRNPKAETGWVAGCRLQVAGFVDRGRRRDTNFTKGHELAENFSRRERREHKEECQRREFLFHADS